MPIPAAKNDPPPRLLKRYFHGAHLCRSIVASRCEMDVHILTLGFSHPSGQNFLFMGRMFCHLHFNDCFFLIIRMHFYPPNRLFVLIKLRLYTFTFVNYFYCTFYAIRNNKIKIEDYSCWS